MLNPAKCLFARRIFWEGEIPSFHPRPELFENICIELIDFTEFYKFVETIHISNISHKSDEFYSLTNFRDFTNF